MDSEGTTGLEQDLLRLSTSIVLLCGVFLWWRCMRLLYQHEKEEYFAKRGTILLKAYLYCSGVCVIVLLPLSLLSHLQYFFDFQPLVEKNVLFGIFWVFKTHIILLVAFESVAIVFLRVFLQYINVRRVQDGVEKHLPWSSHNTNSKNTSGSAAERSVKNSNWPWLLRHFHIFGNPTKLFLLSLFVSLFQAVVVFVIVGLVSFPYSDEKFAQSVRYVLTFLCGFWVVIFVFLVYCGCKLSSFIDIYGIRNELKYLSYIAYAGAAIVTSLLCLSYIINLYIGVLIASMYGIQTIMSWYISIIWVHNTHSKKRIKQNLNDLSAQMPQMQKITLDEVLENETHFATFMQYLTESFCNESLLFTTILIEIQDYLIENKLWNESNRNCILLRSKRYKLPKSVTISSPIQGLIPKFKKKETKMNNMPRMRAMSTSGSNSSKRRAIAMEQQAHACSDTETHSTHSTHSKEGGSGPDTLEIVLPQSVNQVSLGSDSNSIIINPDVRFEPFVGLLIKLYKHYIEMDKAPMEINISFETRNKMEQFYDILTDQDCLDEKLFWQIWFELNNVCDELFDILKPRLTHCFRVKS